ncbi:sigma-70 family RNA polymerase sigma factor [Spongiivirga citrea]|uniref:RNA polymerase sigma factor n=2 Tax=Spongiivirga citrea TaxID=1481457 RepID=A0A6M0CD10_9FLAO|nr:sigma-70 family RNA polymerase sigma factor [Spongiivirga citrea]
MQPDHLIKKLKDQDSSAFEELYEMYSQSLYGVIYTIVKDGVLAEELLQDTFLKIWNNANTYTSKKGRFFTWILNIARNTAIDAYRSKSYNNKKQNLSADNFVDIIISNEDLNRKTDAIGIEKFVHKLKKKCIKLIDLLYFKGYTQKEAAEVIEIPVGTVKTRLRKCLSDLRELVKE